MVIPLFGTNNNGCLSYCRKEKKFVCRDCNKSFRLNASLYNHKKKFHKHDLPSDSASVRCLEEGCNFVCNFKEKLQKHLSIVHGIKMMYLEMEFDTFTGKVFVCVTNITLF